MKIKYRIIDKLKQYEIIRYIYLFIANFNNDDFKHYIFNRNNYIEKRQYGNENKDKNIYYIFIDSKFGFGAYLRRTLHALFEVDKLNFIPVIEFGKSVYGEPEEFLNTNNVFEYYFIQPNNISVEAMRKSYRVFIFEPKHLYSIDMALSLINNPNDLIVGYNNISDTYLQCMAEIMKKYIKLNDITRKYICKSINNLFPEDWRNKKILGVHVRGTDYNLHWKNHPNIVGLDDYFNTIDDAMNVNKFEYIFLATDDEARLKYFINRYGSKLIYYKGIHRGSGKINISFEKTNRKHDNYLNGLEVLRDIYTLAYCNGLVAGLSQVSIMARIVNKGLEKNFIYEKIINNGIYK